MIVLCFAHSTYLYVCECLCVYALCSAVSNRLLPHFNGLFVLSANLRLCFYRPSICCAMLAFNKHRQNSISILTRTSEMYRTQSLTPTHPLTPTHTHKPLTRHFIYSKYYYLIENKVCADDPTDNFRFFITFSALAMPLSIAIIVIWSIYTHSKHFYHCLFTFCKRVRDEIFITSSNIVLRSVW